MKYKDLSELIRNSRSSRKYLISLPIKKQLILHDEYNDYIHCAQDLHTAANSIDTFYRQVSLSNDLNSTLGITDINLE